MHPVSCINDHHRLGALEWTELFEPVNVKECYYTKGQYAVDNTVVKYMHMYGIRHVRGGSFSNLELSESQRDEIKRMFRIFDNKCFNCGMRGHIAKGCVAGRDPIPPPPPPPSPSRKIYTCRKCNRGFNGFISYNKHEGRCGDHKVFCYKCGKPGHKSFACRARSVKTCYRCGNVSDAFNTCFAKTHIDGTPLDY